MWKTFTFTAVASVACYISKSGLQKHYFSKTKTLWRMLPKIQRFLVDPRSRLIFTNACNFRKISDGFSNWIMMVWRSNWAESDCMVSVLTHVTFHWINSFESESALTIFVKSKWVHKRVCAKEARTHERSKSPRIEKENVLHFKQKICKKHLLKYKTLKT